MMTERLGNPCPICNGDEGVLCATITCRPDGETDYQIPPEIYHRKIMRCTGCDVYINEHELLSNEFYSGDYNTSTYGDRFKKRYEKVMALPPGRSDNKQRVFRIHDFMRDNGFDPGNSDILDIGSGLCVFPAEMMRLGYQVHIVDPDCKSIEHARNIVGIEHATLGSIEDIGHDEHFDLITLNKVLEHVTKPLDVLSNAVARLSGDGVIYIELPDGMNASSAEGFVDRSEFYVEHLTIYTHKSIENLLNSTGLRMLKLEALHEPSGKYTLAAFAKKLKQR